MSEPWRPFLTSKGRPAHVWTQCTATYESLCSRLKGISSSVRQDATTSRRRRTVGSVALVAAITSLGIALKLYFLHTATAGRWDVIRWPDESNYYVPAAQAILAEGASYFLTPRALWNGPVNPLWVALWGADVPTVRIANIALLSAAGLLLWDLARRWRGSGVAAAVLLVYSIHLPLDDLAGSVLTEPPFTALLILALWLAFAPRPRWWTCVASGTAFGLATLTRSATQAFPLLVVVAMGAAWAVPTWRPAVRASVRPVLAFLIGFAVLVGPYVLKNALYLGKPGIANGSGATLYLGNDLRRNGDEPVYSGVDFDTQLHTGKNAPLDSEGDRRLMEVAVARIREHPAATALLTARKAFRLVFGSPVSYFYPSDTLGEMWHHRVWSVTGRAVLELLLISSISVFAMFGLWSARRIPAAARVALGGLALYFVAVHSVLFAIPRMMVPLFPVLCLGATGAFDLGRVGRRAAVVVWAFSVLWLCFSGLARHPELATERFVSYHRAERVIEPGDSIAPTGLKDGVSTAPDAAFDVALERFTARRSQVVFVYLTATVAADGKAIPESKPIVGLSWRREGSQELVPGQDLFLRVDGAEHIYRFTPSLDPAWPAVLDRLRIRLPQDLPGVRYRLRKVIIAS